MADLNGRQEDQALIKRVLRGEQEAFRELIEPGRAKLLRTLTRVTGNQEDAEDALQIAYTRAYERLNWFKGESRFNTWMTRIAINEALTVLRQKRPWKLRTLSLSEPNEEGAQQAFEVADERPGPEVQVREGERRQLVHRAIGSLLPSMHRVLQARYLEGLSAAETAAMFGMTIAAVKAVAHRGKLRLRMRLEHAV